MARDNSARRLFIPAALFNFAAGGLFLFAMPWLAGSMRIELTPSAMPFVHITASAVLLFGWGYWQAGVDPVRNRIAIVMGMVGKIAVVAVAFGHALAGGIGWGLPALTVVDLVFAILFWRFLRAHPAA
ncbi:MAG: hypothetical protein IT518_00475 [Burkholderiales bacterium]|nr:hypothetical protein [Burkholderiales bacterium]